MSKTWRYDPFEGRLTKKGVKKSKLNKSSDYDIFDDTVNINDTITYKKDTRKYKDGY